MSQMNKENKHEVKNNVAIPVTLSPGSQPSAFFQLDGSNLGSRRSVFASSLGAYKFHHLLHTCFKLSFRTFIESGKDKLEIKHTKKVISNVLEVIHDSNKLLHDSFIHDESINLEFQSVVDIVDMEWLKDDAIYGILDSLNMTQGHNETINNKATTYCFDSVLFSKLVDPFLLFNTENETNFAATFANQIKNGNMKSLLYKIIQDHANIKRIHFVVNINNRHYNSLLSDISSKSITSTDPYEGEDMVMFHRSTIAKTIGVFYHIAHNPNQEKIYLGKNDMKIPVYRASNIDHSMPSFSHKSVANTVRNLPKQKDGHNCGVLSLFYIMSDFFNISLELHEKFDPDTFRYQMFLYYFLIKIFLESAKEIPKESYPPPLDDEFNEEETVHIIRFIYSQIYRFKNTRNKVL